MMRRSGNKKRGRQAKDGAEVSSSTIEQNKKQGKIHFDTEETHLEGQSSSVNADKSEEASSVIPDSDDHPLQPTKSTTDNVYVNYDSYDLPFTIFQ